MSADAAELQRQVDTLVRLGYPGLMGMEEAALRSALEPLADALPGLVTGPGRGVDPDDHVPFVLVVTAVPLAAAASLMTLGARSARLMIGPDEIDGYLPVADVELPVGPSAHAYVLADVDTGSDLCGVTPQDALGVIRERGRTPLTIAEGIALVTHRPDMLRPNRCFSLLGSRRGDQRVPALWISERAPKLGWCWDRNPHTWLGSASAGSRVAG